MTLRLSLSGYCLSKLSLRSGANAIKALINEHNNSPAEGRLIAKLSRLKIWCTPIGSESALHKSVHDGGPKHTSSLPLRALLHRTARLHGVKATPHCTDLTTMFRPLISMAEFFQSSFFSSCLSRHAFQLPSAPLYPSPSSLPPTARK